MPRGGKREGAGRKAGAAWYGPNHSGGTALRRMSREKVKLLLEKGADPLEMLCAVAVNDDLPLDVRMHAAALALPHIHPRLTAVAMANVTPPTPASAGQLVAELSAKLEGLRSPPLLDASTDASSGDNDD